MAPIVAVPLEKSTTVHPAQVSTSIVQEDRLNKRIGTFAKFGEAEGGIDL